MLEPVFKFENAQQRDDMNVAPLARSTERSRKGTLIQKTKRSRNPLDVAEPRIIVGECGHGAAHDESFSATVQNFVRYDSGERSSHERTALTRAKQLIRRNSVEEFQQITVEIGIAPLVERVRGEPCAGELAAQRFERLKVVVKARARAEKA